jgi:arylsulfatase A-like enzyme
LSVRGGAALALSLAVAACSTKPSSPAIADPVLVPALPSSIEELLPEITFTHAAAPAAAAADAAPKRWRVVIISEDGLRPDALDPQLTPNHFAVMKAGMTAKHAHTVHPSETLCSHASMLSGFSPAEHKMTWDGYIPKRGQIALPTIFAIAGEHGLSTAMFIGKKKLWHIAPKGSVEHYEKPGFLCNVVAAHAASYFESHQPDLMFVHFTDPDNAGHGHGWMTSAYLTAVHESDRCLGMILDAIDHAGVADSTLLIVTADHGGSGRAHSGRGGELDTSIPWIARGPLIPPGSVLAADVDTVDTAVTALTALQLPLRSDMVGVSRWPPPPAAPRIAQP